MQIPESVKFRLIAIDAISTEVIQILGHTYKLDPEFFRNRTSMRRSHEAGLHISLRKGANGQFENRGTHIFPEGYLKND